MRTGLIRMFGLAALAMVAFAPVSAQACFRRGDALIHREPPAYTLPGMIVAEVEIYGDDEGALYEGGLLARVRRVVSGRLSGEWVILRWPLTDCSEPFRNGRTGYLVAVERDRPLAVPRLEPLPAMAEWGEALPDSELDEAWLADWVRGPSPWWDIPITRYSSAPRAG